MTIRDFVNGLPQLDSGICKKTERADLLKFFSEIRPVTTNHKLTRIGGEADGGYLIPDDLGGIEACFSPGVAQTADFEMAMAARRIPCYMADYSVEAAPVKNPLFNFEKKYLGPVNEEMFMTLENWVNRCAPNSKEMILQMDIEGAEYGVILESEMFLLERFRIIVVEFHQLEDLWLQKGYELIRLAFLKLLKRFEIVHIHPNNNARMMEAQGLGIPSLMEFTFLRKDRIASKVFTEKFPHPLDGQNVEGRRNLALPECWYKAER